MLWVVEVMEGGEMLLIRMLRMKMVLRQGIRRRVHFVLMGMMGQEGLMLLLLLGERGGVLGDVGPRLIGRMQAVVNVVFFAQDGLEDDGVAVARARRRRRLLRHHRMMRQVAARMSRMGLLLLLPFERLSASRLILVIRVLIFVLQSQSFGFFVKRLFFRIAQQPP